MLGGTGSFHAEDDRLRRHLLLPRSVDSKIHLGTSFREHIDESVDRKLLDLAVHKIGDSRLTHTEELRGFLLSQSVLLDEATQTDHQVRSDLEVLSLIVLEAEVFEDVTAAFSIFRVVVSVREFGM